MPLRDSSDRISPPFLLGPNGSKLRQAVNLVGDGIAQLANMGVRARFPESAPEDALPYIGRDRRIIRGYSESSASYRARLKQWPDPWRTAGASFALLRQIRGYLTPHTSMVRLVFNSPGLASAQWYTIATNGTESYVSTAPNNWDWDGSTTSWWRFWVIIYPTSGPTVPWTVGPVWNNAGLWGGAWGTPGYTWGSTATPDEVASIRQIIADWKPAHAVCQNIIIAFDAAIMSPTAAPGAPMPDGTWGKNWKLSGGVAVATRNASALYWDGV